MATDTKSVTIVCPICKKQVAIEIPVLLVREAQDGILKIQIPQDRCCGLHSFMVFIDKHFDVRGYQHADIEFNLKVAGNSSNLDHADAIFDTNELLDAVGIDVAAMMLRTALVDKQIFFINMFDEFDPNNYVQKTMQFFHDIESSDIAIKTHVINNQDLNNKKLDTSNAFVFAILYKAILRSPFNNKIKTALEGNLLEEATAIPDRQGQVAFLRKELVKLSKIIVEMATILKAMPKIYEEDLPELLQKKFNYKIKKSQAEGIKEIIAYRYGEKLANKIRSKTLDYML